jgi:hypothetical protein
MILDNNDEGNRTRQEKIQFVFAKNTRFCGERIEVLIRREGSFFFDVGTSNKTSNASSIRSMPFSEIKGVTHFFTSLDVIALFRIAICCRHGSN